MAFCDFLIGRPIKGYECDANIIKGVQPMGWLINRADIASVFRHAFLCVDFTLKDGATPYRVYQSGKQPFNGTQQEMVEGVYQNTITNTLHVVVLKQDEDWAQQLYALINGEFVAAINFHAHENTPGYITSHIWTVLGSEAGLHCTGAVREIYNDDTLSGWELTFVEEGASRLWFTEDPALIPTVSQQSTPGNSSGHTAIDLSEWDLGETDPTTPKV